MRTGRNLRAMRKRRGLTLTELGALCGVSRDDLGAYERGTVTPRPEAVRRIAAALEVPLETIRQGMGWTESGEAEAWETAAPGRLLEEGIAENLRALEPGGPEAPPPDEAELRALMNAVRASIPALVERLKDTRPEDVIHRELLRELECSGGEETEGQDALTDLQWEQLRDLLPPENAGRGRAYKSNRLMLEGIVYWMRSGADWKQLPARFGRYQCVSGRLRLWKRTGVWEPVQRRLLELNILEPECLRETPPFEAVE